MEDQKNKKKYLVGEEENKKMILGSGGRKRE